MPRPGLFIVGAPKCGTTSLAAWLGEHSDIFVSNPKEPYFYSPDVASTQHVRTRAAYEALFEAAGPGQLCIDASTSYLRSREAPRAILSDVPTARMVICLRNPVEMARSVHGQLLRAGRENIRDFADAWALQSTRLEQKEPLAPGHNPADQQYGEMCMLGAQVERFLNVVPREQVHFVFLDDLRNDPGAAYRNVLAFAGIEDDGRTEFAIHNSRRVPRSVAVAEFSRRAATFKRTLGIDRSLGLGRLLNRANEVRPEKSLDEPDQTLITEMQEFFREDVAMLSQITGRNLDHWLSQGKDLQA